MATEMFLEYGFKSVTMDDIAEKLAISKKTIYSYYATKTKLVQDVVTNILETINNATIEIKKKNLNAIEEFFEIKKQISIFLKDEKTSPQYQLQKYYPKIFDNVECTKAEMILASIKENIHQGIAEGLFRKDLDIDFISKLHQQAFKTIRNADIFPQPAYNKKDVFQLYIEYHIRGIATIKGLETLEELIKKDENTTR